MLVSLQALAAWMVLVLAGVAPGWVLVRWLRLDWLDGVPRWTWMLSLGWLLWSGVLLALGHLRLLVPELLAPASFAAAAAGVLLGVRMWGQRKVDIAPAWATCPRDESGRTKPLSVRRTLVPGAFTWERAAGVAVLLAAGCVAGLALVAALAPPTAGDALCYQLNLPKRFLLHRGLYYTPWDDNITYPLVVQLWYAWALAVGPPPTATLVHWTCGLLLAGAAWHLGGQVLGRRWAHWPAALVLLVPGVGNQMTVPLNDLPLAVYATLALAGWLELLRPENAGGSWSVATGLAAAGALGVKYAAAVPLGALAGVAALGLLRLPNRAQLVRRGLGVLLVALLAGGYWYARATYYRSNPVYPLLADRLGTAVTPPKQRDKTPLPVRATAIAAAPWQVTFRPERFGGRGHRLGVLFLALLPAMVLVRPRGRRRWLLAYLALCALGWFVLRQNLRFLLPAVPAALVLGTGALLRLKAASRAAAWALVFLLAVAAADALGGAARKTARTWAVACGVQSRPEYLAAHVSWYPAARMLQTQEQPVRILTTDVRLFPLPGRAVRESVYARVTGYHRCLGPQAALDALVRDGFTHLLIAGRGRSAARLRRLCRQWHQAGQVRLVLEGNPTTPAEQHWQLWQVCSDRRLPGGKTASGLVGHLP